MKNSVEAMNQHGGGFKFLKDLFGADKSDSKLKAGALEVLKLEN